MRWVRLLGIAALTSIVLLSQPAPASADHCGADATATPTSGPPGTTFVFRTNLGAPSELQVFHDERLVKVLSLDGHAVVRYRIRTGPGDAGTWRAHAAVVGRPDCAAEASFSVVGPPDTSTVASPRAPLVGGERRHGSPSPQPRRSCSSSVGRRGRSAPPIGDVRHWRATVDW